MGNQSVGGVFGQVNGTTGTYSHYECYFEITYCANNSGTTGESYVGRIVGKYNRLKTDSNLMDTNTTIAGDKLGH